MSNNNSCNTSENGDIDASGQFSINEKVWVKVGEKRKIARVKYIGSVNFASGIWIGLELPAAEGKNDGSIQGRRYFHCKPNCGLFVKAAVVSKLETSPSPMSSPLPPSNPNPNKDAEEASSSSPGIPRSIFTSPTRTSTKSRIPVTATKEDNTNNSLSKETIIDTVLSSEAFTNAINDMMAQVKTEITEDVSEKMQKIEKRIQANESSFAAIEKSMSHVQTLVEYLTVKISESHVEIKDQKDAQIQTLRSALNEVSRLAKQAHQEALRQQAEMTKEGNPNTNTNTNASTNA